MKTLKMIALICAFPFLSMAQNTVALADFKVPALDVYEEETPSINTTLFLSGDNQLLMVIMDTKADQFVSINIYNKKGRCVLSKNDYVIHQESDNPNTNITDLELPKLPKGAYTVAIQNQHKTILQEHNIDIQ